MPDNPDPGNQASGMPAVSSWGLSGWLLAAVSVGGLSWLWGRTSKSFDELRKVAINLLVLMPVCLIVYTVYQAVNEDVMIIDSFTLPKSLSDEGYTSTIVTTRVIDSVKDVHSTANARVDRLQIGHESQFASLSNLEVPQSGLTIQTFVSLLRKVLKLQDDKIEGDIEIKQAAGRLRTREFT